MIDRFASDKEVESFSRLDLLHYDLSTGGDVPVIKSRTAMILQRIPSLVVKMTPSSYFSYALCLYSLMCSISIQ